MHDASKVRRNMTTMTGWPPKNRKVQGDLMLPSNFCLDRDILEVGYWRSPGTFVQFYLRDVSRLGDDSSFGVASAVVTY